MSLNLSLPLRPEATPLFLGHTAPIYYDSVAGYREFLTTVLHETQAGRMDLDGLQREALAVRSLVAQWNEQKQSRLTEVWERIHAYDDWIDRRFPQQLRRIERLLHPWWQDDPRAPLAREMAMAELVNQRLRILQASEEFQKQVRASPLPSFPPPPDPKPQRRRQLDIITHDWRNEVLWFLWLETVTPQGLQMQTDGRQMQIRVQRPLQLRLLEEPRQANDVARIQLHVCEVWHQADGSVTTETAC